MSLDREVRFTSSYIKGITVPTNYHFELLMKKVPKVKTAFSIPKHCYEALDNFSKQTGISKSKFISDVLEENLDTLERLCEAITMAKNGDKEGATREINQLEMDVSSRLKPSS